MLRRAHGFTLVELLIALTLLALISAVIFGALDLSGRSWDRGEVRAEATARNFFVPTSKRSIPCGCARWRSFR